MVKTPHNILLAPGFSVSVKKLLAACSARGIKMVPYESLRSPRLQAKYWKRGRSQEDIEQALILFKRNNAGFLADCLASAEGDRGKIITYALPGCSWHQWGEALDCYWQHGDKAVWDLDTRDSNGINGYEVFAEEAARLGLNAGYYWTTLVDAMHVQQREADSPLSIYTLAEIDEVMKDTFN